MGSFNISIKEEAYDFLKSLKTKDKSFSDVILEFKQKDTDILEFFGALKEVDWDAKKERMQEVRRDFEARLG
tara:strand:- start:343 stop:558 length:216 start_codon:yes stop_codon:yes gene_type:complete